MIKKIVFTSLFLLAISFISYKTAFALFKSTAVNQGNSFTAAAQFSTTPNVGIKINEFFPDPSTGGSEWVEIFNGAASSVDLTGWKITDNNGVSDDISLSGSIGANSFIAFDHSSGWLNNTGDTVNLLNASSQIIDTVAYTSSLVGIDKSIGRNPDGTGGFKKCLTVTKAASNVGC